MTTDSKYYRMAMRVSDRIGTFDAGWEDRMGIWHSMYVDLWLDQLFDNEVRYG